MSSYGSVDSFDFPHIQDRKTGAKRCYSRSTLRGTTSRSLNRTESLEHYEALEKELGERIEQVHREMAFKFLDFLRSQLEGFKTHRHDIWIDAGMGTTSVMVGEEFASEYRSTLPIVERLQEIDQLLEGRWEWVSYLEGAKLNGEGWMPGYDPT